MNQSQHNHSYSLEWFRERAENSVKRLENGAWDYSDSLLLWVPGSEEEYASIQKGDDPYARLITKPERAYLERIAERLIATLPNEFEYLDLGPGTAHKEQFVFDAARKAGKTFVYRPVDISAEYLKLAEDYAIAQGIRTDGVQASFEELAERLGQPVLPRFVSLGLTFTNYDPQEILAILKEIAGAGGVIFVDAQMRDRVDMNEVVKIYEEDLPAVADSKLALLDVKLETDIEAHHADDGIRLWCTVKHVNGKLEKLGVRPGDRLMILKSLRYTKETLEKELKLAHLAHDLLDTGETFVGACIKVHEHTKTPV